VVVERSTWSDATRPTHALMGFEGGGEKGCTVYVRVCSRVHVFPSFFLQQAVSQSE